MPISLNGSTFIFKRVLWNIYIQVKLFSKYSWKSFYSLYKVGWKSWCCQIMSYTGITSDTRQKLFTRLLKIPTFFSSKEKLTYESLDTMRWLMWEFLSFLRSIYFWQSLFIVANWNIKEIVKRHIKVGLPKIFHL